MRPNPTRRRYPSPIPPGRRHDRAPPEDEEEEIEASKAPLLDHLLELRDAADLVDRGVRGLVPALLLLRPGDLRLPHLSALRSDEGTPNNHLIATGLPETFFTYMKVGMFAGLCLAFPVVAAQVWLFVAPGLYRNERKAFLPFLFATPVLFVIGAAFVLYVMMPFAIRALMSLDTPGGDGKLGIQLLPKVSEYLDFVTTLVFAFGLTLPDAVLLTLLGRVGIVTSAQLRQARRYAIVGITAVSAVLTPPDVFSMVSLVVPLVLLYEISIGCVWLIERGRRKEETS